MAKEQDPKRATRGDAAGFDCGAALDQLLVLASSDADGHLSAKSAAILSADIARTLAERLARS
jgi:hypothetical protein